MTGAATATAFQTPVPDILPADIIQVAYLLFANNPSPRRPFWPLEQPVLRARYILPAPPPRARKLFKAETRSKARALVLSVALLLAGTAFMARPTSAASFENVQVFATTPSTLPFSYEFAAYNLTGSLVASTETSYPAAAFELPAGGYLFTVSATSTYDHLGYACPLVEGGTANASGAVSPAKANSSSEVVLPYPCSPPSSEYGYATADISAPQTLNIQMQNVTTLPTTTVTARVSYLNGTAASGVSVDASIVGEWYYWWGPNSSVTMQGQWRPRW
jgi:hypothetical protein